MYNSRWTRQAKPYPILWAMTLIALLLFSWIACNKPTPFESREETGSLILQVKIADSVTGSNRSDRAAAPEQKEQALNKSTAIISRVVITISAPDMKTIVKKLQVPANSFSAKTTVTGIPSGSNRRVKLELCEADTVVRYRGETKVTIQTGKTVSSLIEVSTIGINIRNLHPGDEASDYLVYVQGMVSDPAEDRMVKITANGLNFPSTRITDSGEFYGWVAIRPGSNTIRVEDSQGRSDEIELQGKVADTSPLFFLVWPELEGRLFNLHVFEPNNEHAYLDHPTTQGGTVSKAVIGPTGKQFSVRSYGVDGTLKNSGSYSVMVNYAQKASQEMVDVYLYAWLGQIAISGPARLLGPHAFEKAEPQLEDYGTNPDAWWISARVNLPEGRFTSTPSGPAEPVLSSPADATILRGSSVDFSWTPVSAASRYELQISPVNDTLLSDADPTPSPVGEAQMTVNLTADGKYCWRVRSLDAGGNAGAWSRLFNFFLTQNRPPEFKTLPDSVIQIQEDKIRELEVKAADPDAADLLVFSIENAPNFIKLANKGSGVASLLLSPISGDGSKGPESGMYKGIIVRVSDNGQPNLVDTFEFDIRVAAKQAAPSLISIESFTMFEAEDTPRQIAIVASDPNGDTITLSAENRPAFVTFTDQGSGKGLLVFNPGYDDAGSYPIRIIALDNGTPAGADNITFNATILNKNRPPTLENPGDKSNREGETFTPGLQMVANDADANPLVWSMSGGPTGLSIDQNGWISGAIPSGTPANSPYLTTVTVRDSEAAASVTFKWIITSEKPDLRNPGDQNSYEGDLVAFQITATDPNNDSLRYYATNLPKGLSINTKTGSISGPIASDAALSSPYQVTVRVQDASATQWESSVSFTWYVTNPAPEWIAPTDQTNKEQEEVRLQLLASDDDQAKLRYSIVTPAVLPAGLTLDDKTGLISGKPSYDASGTYPMTISVTDGELAAETSFTWTITNTNRAPRFTTRIANQMSTEGESPELALAAEDSDGDTSLIFSATGLPPGLMIEEGSGLIHGQLDYASGGGASYAVTVTVNDGHDASSAIFSWTINDKNRAPMVVNPGTLTNAENDSVDIGIMADDVDDDPVTFKIDGLEKMLGALQYDQQSGKIWGKLNYDLVNRVDLRNTYPIKVTVTDKKGATTTIDFNWIVKHTNRPPKITRLVDRESKENLEIDPVQIEAIDEDGDGLLYYQENLPPDLSINLSSGLIYGKIILNAADLPNYEVKITVSDGYLRSEPMIFNWHVTK